MGGLEIDDNISNYYYFGGVGVILANAYIIYICIHNMNVKPMKPKRQKSTVKLCLNLIAFGVS